MVVIVDAWSRTQLVQAMGRGLELGALDHRLVALSESAIGAVGDVMLTRARPDDRLDLFLPVQVVARAKISPGALLLMRTGVIVAWSEGLARSECFSVASELATVRDVERGARRVGLSASLDTLGFWAASSYVELVFPTAVIRPDLVGAVRSLLTLETTFGREPEATAGEGFGITFELLRHPQGAGVRTVAPGSKAELAGLTDGAVLTHVDGRRVEDGTEAAAVLGALRDAPRVELRWWVDGTVGRGWCGEAGRTPPGPRTGSNVVLAKSSTPLTVDDVRREADLVVRAYLEGDFEQAWQRRSALGHRFPHAGIGRHDLFWLNATAALAGLHLGHREHPLVETCCAEAAARMDPSDHGQRVVVRELTFLRRGRPEPG